MTFDQSETSETTQNQNLERPCSIRSPFNLNPSAAAGLGSIPARRSCAKQRGQDRVWGLSYSHLRRRQLAVVRKYDVDVGDIDFMDGDGYAVARAPRAGTGGRVGFFPPSRVPLFLHFVLNIAPLSSFHRVASSRPSSRAVFRLSSFLHLPSFSSVGAASARHRKAMQQAKTIVKSVCIKLSQCVPATGWRRPAVATRCREPWFVDATSHSLRITKNLT